MLKNCNLPSDIIINVMDKCYSACLSHIKLKQKGLRVGKIRYLQKDGHYIIPFFSHCFKVINKKIRLSLGKKVAEKVNGNKKFMYINLPIKFHKNKHYKIKMIEICPIYDGYKYKINFVYDKEKKIKEEQNDLISIDLGVKNLMTIYDPKSQQKIIRGSFLTTPNYYFNKKIDELKSKLPLKCKTSKKIRNLLIKRDNIINHRMNMIVNKLYELYKNKQGIVIGYNERWKQHVTLGRRNNRKFYEIPYAKLKKKMENKFEDVEIIKINEAYTSKCDSLMLEEIGRKNKYTGKRTMRGLFLSGTGQLVNADLNGAINIMRLYCKKENIKFERVSGNMIMSPKEEKIERRCYL
jgi:IS605 OrfB family transposase